jgi:hypothetical protein
MIPTINFILTKPDLFNIFYLIEKKDISNYEYHFLTYTWFVIFSGVLINSFERRFMSKIGRILREKNVYITIYSIVLIYII